jgi:hypothetical protein
VFPSGIALVDHIGKASPKIPKPSQAVTLQSIVIFLSGLLWVHEPLGNPKVWQPLTKPDGVDQLNWISAVSLYITVTYPVKQIAIPTTGDYRGTPTRKMLRVKDRQEVDIISNASEVEDGHRKQKGGGQFAPPLDVSPLV